ncbi:hypothetical protein P7H17_04785 [Paenibacillus larvae]|nr:hypothetical protein [Paenibacillus larvae]MDT2285546.1 hypothetical protein [Paenibacillus larvae]
MLGKRIKQLFIQACRDGVVSIYYEMDDRTLDKLKQSLQAMICN